MFKSGSGVFNVKGVVSSFFPLETYYNNEHALSLWKVFII